jgi:hypothetical protein
MLTSKTLPTMTFCSALSSTPGAVLMLVFSMPKSLVGPPALCWLWFCIEAVSEGIPVDMLRDMASLEAVLVGVAVQVLMLDEIDLRVEERIKLL